MSAFCAWLCETRLTQRSIDGSHKVAGKCPQLRLVEGKATFVLNAAARRRLAEVSEPIVDGTPCWAYYHTYHQFR